jgi:hypothetical protein
MEIQDNTQKSKMYGEHCNYDNDCIAGKSLVCQNGVCLCSSTTYYDSISFTGSCGNFYYWIKKLYSKFWNINVNPFK